MFLVCVGMSVILELSEKALISIVVIAQQRSLGCAAVETVECALRTVEYGGLGPF